MPYKKLTPQNNKERIFILSIREGETGHLPEGKKGAAVSDKGAKGSMQIMPGTYKDVMGSMKGWNDPEQLEAAGITYALTQFRAFGGDVRRASGAYNRGPIAEREKKLLGPRGKYFVNTVADTYDRLRRGAASIPKPKPEDPKILQIHKDRRKTTMASKDKVLKRLLDLKKGKPTFQDKNRLKTWKDAGEGSRDQEHGYNRALRNIQRSIQQGRAVNEVDAEIAKLYIKETPQQLLDKSKTFIDMMTWFGGGAAVKGVTKAASGFAKPLTAAAKAAKKASETTVKKAAAPTTRVAKEVVKKAVVPVRGAAQRVAGKLSGSIAAKAAAKKALKTAQRKAQRARISARNKVLGDIAKGGVHTQGLARKADRAGRTAYNKIMKQHGKAAKATTAVRQAKNLRRGQIAGGAALAAVPAVVALTGDEKNEKKVPIPKAKPTGSEVFWERAKRAKAARAKAAEQKAITRSRAGRDTGIGEGRDIYGAIDRFQRNRAKHLAKVKAAEKKAITEKDENKETQRELKFWEGGVRYINLPEWLGGGRIKVDSSAKALEYGTPEYKHGGQIQRSMKKPETNPRKVKAKTRKHAALGSKPKGVGAATHGYG
ncbi:MAG: lytic transglycosylase domain-containing protein, partial [Thermodesulfobacteriota bacterium]